MSEISAERRRPGRGRTDQRSCRSCRSVLPSWYDGGHCLPERHADRHEIHRKLEPHDVLDDDLVPIKIVLILEEQLQGLGLLIGLLGGLLDDRVGHVVVTVVITVGVGKHFFVTKEQVANDRVDDADADVLGQRVVLQLHVAM